MDDKRSTPSLSYLKEEQRKKVEEKLKMLQENGFPQGIVMIPKAMMYEKTIEELKSLKKDVQRYFELTNDYLENDEWKELHEKLSKVRSEE